MIDKNILFSFLTSLKQHGLFLGPLALSRRPLRSGLLLKESCGPFVLISVAGINFSPNLGTFET